MRSRKSWSIGLLVVVALLASSALRPAAACHDKCHFNINGPTCVSALTNIMCNDGPDGCVDVGCSSPAASLAAPGSVAASVADASCSAQQRTAAATSAAADLGPIRVAVLKARR